MALGSKNVRMADSATSEPPHQDDGLIELIEALQQVDTTSLIAKLNEATIADNNGGRIEL